MESSKSQSPYALLGEKLRQVRETRRESLAEVSGAVEIDTDLLERIEQGEVCPSEDILTLLISHFALHEQDAIQLWEWAGFAGRTDEKTDNVQDLASKATVVLIAIDARVQYSDNVNIKIDDNGVVLNFMQAGLQGQPIPAARVGMSHEHAKKFIDVMQSLMLRYKYLPRHKLLPPGTQQ